MTTFFWRPVLGSVISQFSRNLEGQFVAAEPRPFLVHGVEQRRVAGLHRVVHHRQVAPDVDERVVGRVAGLRLGPTREPPELAEPIGLAVLPHVASLTVSSSCAAAVASAVGSCSTCRRPGLAYMTSTATANTTASTISWNAIPR